MPFALRNTLLLSQTHPATQRDVDAASYRHVAPPPPAVNDDFARRIKQAERAYHRRNFAPSSIVKYQASRFRRGPKIQVRASSFSLSGVRSNSRKAAS